MRWERRALWRGDGSRTGRRHSPLGTQQLGQVVGQQDGAQVAGPQGSGAAQGRAVQHHTARPGPRRGGGRAGQRPQQALEGLKAPHLHRQPRWRLPTSAQRQHRWAPQRQHRRHGLGGHLRGKGEEDSSTPGPIKQFPQIPAPGRGLPTPPRPTCPPGKAALSAARGARKSRWRRLRAPLSFTQSAAGRPRDSFSARSVAATPGRPSPISMGA